METERKTFLAQALMGLRDFGWVGQDALLQFGVLLDLVMAQRLLLQLLEEMGRPLHRSNRLPSPKHNGAATGILPMESSGKECW
jgi:hypothetical protein